MQNQVFVVVVGGNFVEFVLGERDLCRVGQFLDFGPTHHFLFPRCVGRGNIAHIGVFAVVHQIPIFQRLIIDGLRTFYRRIDVGQAERVRKFVAEQTDAVDDDRLQIDGAVDFVVHTVAAHGFAVVGSETARARFRPNAVVGVARDALGIACVDDIDQIDITVIVAVVLREIDLVVDGFTSLFDEFAEVDVFGFSLVFSVIIRAFWHGHRTIDVEFRTEESVAHIGEILLYAAVVEVFVKSSVWHLSPTFSVQIVVERRFRVGHAEGRVGELHENHQRTRFARMGKIGWLHRSDGDATLHGSLFLCTRMVEKGCATWFLLRNELFFGFEAVDGVVGELFRGFHGSVLVDFGHEKVATNLCEQNTVGGGIPMEIFVAVADDGQLRAVALGDDDGFWISFHSPRCRRNQHQAEGE